MHSNRKTTASKEAKHKTYTESALTGLVGGFAVSLLATVVNGICGRSFCADPDDPEPDLSIPERVAFFGAGVAGMAVTSGAGLPTLMVTIPLDIATGIYRNSNSFFHSKKEKTPAREEAQYETSLEIIPCAEPQKNEELNGSLEIICSRK